MLTPFRSARDRKNLRRISRAPHLSSKIPIPRSPYSFPGTRVRSASVAPGSFRVAGAATATMVAATELPLPIFSLAVAAAVVYPSVDACVPFAIGSLWSAWEGPSLYEWSSSVFLLHVSVIASPGGAG